MGYVLEAEGLGKVYGKKVVLNGFSLKVKKGSIFGLLGPNGAGKSTFIRILSGLEKQDTGTLKLLGANAGKDSRKQLGVAPQENAIYSLLTCMENLTYFGSLYGVNGKTARTRAASANSYGYYGVKLPQGSYRVNVTDVEGNSFGMPYLDYTQSITIEKDHKIVMDFDIDTGIR